MQAACFLECFEAWAQVKMIGVAKNDLCIDVGLELTLVHRFDRTRCADRHKDRSRYFAVGGGDHPGASLGLGVSCLNRELHRAKIRFVGYLEPISLRAFT